jgi:hypothetical protein
MPVEGRGLGSDRNHIPAMPLGDGLKLTLLVLDRLLCSD